jgi:hypothetical protein
MYRVFPSLEPLFPSGYTLVGNDEGRLLSLLARVSSEGEQGRLLAQEYLTPTEWRILLALIEVSILRLVCALGSRAHLVV